MVRANLPWNFAVNLMDVSLVMLGYNIISRTTILPLLVSQLTGSTVVVGLVPAVFMLCSLLPQLLVTNFTEQLPYKKPFLVRFAGIGERVPYLGIGLVVMLYGAKAPAMTAAVVLLLLGLAAGLMGVGTPAWLDLIAKVIPVRKRGLWRGMTNGVGALLGIGGAAAAGYLLERYPFPLNFGLCFLLASFWFALSFIGLTLNREPPSRVAKESVPLVRYLKRLPDVIREDRNFAHFLVARSIIGLGTMASAFYAVYAVQEFGIEGRQIGGLTGLMIGTQAVTNVIWGRLADRAGNKIVLVAGAAVTACACGSAWFATSPVGMWVTFALIGVATGAEMVGGMNITLEFGEPEKRPTYVGLTHTLLAPAASLAPVIGGWLAVLLNFRFVFATSALLSILGGLVLAVWVSDPRRKLGA